MSVSLLCTGFCRRVCRPFIAISLFLVMLEGITEPLPVHILAAPTETKLVQLSPEGSRIAVLSGFRDGDKNISQVDVFDLKTREKKSVLTRSSNAIEILGLHWLNENRLLVEINNQSSALIDLTTGDIDELNKAIGISFVWKLVSVVQGDEPFILGENPTSDEEWLWRYDGLTGSGIVVNRGKGQAFATDWFADQQGNPRLKRFTFSDRIEYELTPAGTEQYELAWYLKPLDVQTFDPIVFEPNGRYFYAYQQIEGTIALVKIDSENPTSEPEVVLHYPDFDVSGQPIFDMPETGNIVGFNVDWLHQSIVWEEPLVSMRQQLEQKFPTAHIQFKSIDSQTGGYIVLISEKGKPGIFYLGNFKLNTLQPLLPSKPKLMGNPAFPIETRQIDLGRVGNDSILGEYFSVSDPGERRGAVIFASSNSLTEDEDGFDALGQFLVSRGIEVVKLRDKIPSTSFNSNVPMLAGFNKGFPNWSHSVEERLKVASDWLVTQDLPADRICILGEWFGGSVAITTASQYPDKFSCVITLNSQMDYGDWLSAAHTATAELYKIVYEDVFGASSKKIREISPIGMLDQIHQPMLMIDTLYNSDESDQKMIVRKLNQKGVDAEFYSLENTYFRAYSPEVREKFFSLIEKFLDRQFPRSIQ